IKIAAYNEALTAVSTTSRVLRQIANASRMSSRGRRARCRRGRVGLATRARAGGRSPPPRPFGRGHPSLPPDMLPLDAVVAALDLEERERRARDVRNAQLHRLSRRDLLGRHQQSGIAGEEPALITRHELEDIGAALPALRRRKAAGRKAERVLAVDPQLGHP